MKRLVAAISLNPNIRARIFIDGLCVYDRNPGEFSRKNVDIIELINFGWKKWMNYLIYILLLLTCILLGYYNYLLRKFKIIWQTIEIKLHLISKLIKW